MHITVKQKQCILMQTHNILILNYYIELLFK